MIAERNINIGGCEKNVKTRGIMVLNIAIEPGCISHV